MQFPLLLIVDTDFSRTPLLPVPLREDLGAVFDSAALSILSILNIYRRVVVLENRQSSSNLSSHSICTNIQRNDKRLSCHPGAKVMPLPGSKGLVGNFSSHFGVQMFMEKLGHLWNSPNIPDQWLCTLAEHGDPMENYFLLHFNVCLSLHLVDSTYQTQVIKLRSKHPYPLIDLTSPREIC